MTQYRTQDPACDPPLEGVSGDTIHAVCIGGPLNRQIRTADLGHDLLEVRIKTDIPHHSDVTVSYIHGYVTLRYRRCVFHWTSPRDAERPCLARRRLFWVYHTLSDAESRRMICAELGLADAPK